MPCSKTLALRWLPLLLLLTTTARAADPVKLSGVTLESARRQLTVTSTSNNEDFTAAITALEDPVNWMILFGKETIPIRDVTVRVRTRAITIEYEARSLPFEDARDIPANTLALTYRALPPTTLLVPTGTAFPAPVAGYPSLSRCFNYRLTEEKQAADIDITGGWQAAVHAKPQYFWSVKAACLLPIGAGDHWGKLGPSFNGEASQEENADPDSLKVAITYRKDFAISNSRNGWRLVADPLSYEFERAIKKDAALDDEGKPVLQKFTEKNANLVWTGMLRYVNGWRRLNWTLGIAGFEAGHSQSRTIKASSDESERQPVRRLHVDLNLYKTVFRKNDPIVVLHGYHALRWPFRPEPFQKADVNNGEMYLTNKPRHWTLLEVTLLMAKGAGLNLQYKNGSLPPSFESVEHQVTAGISIQLRSK